MVIVFILALLMAASPASAQTMPPRITPEVPNTPPPADWYPKTRPAFSETEEQRMEGLRQQNIKRGAPANGTDQQPKADELPSATLPGIPLMPGLVAEDYAPTSGKNVDGSSFRMINARGMVPVSDILRYYGQTLPQSGWTLSSQDDTGATYTSGNTLLTIYAMQVPGTAVHVTFMQKTIGSGNVPPAMLP